MSKSAGVVFTPQTWFRYGSPQSLMLLMLKRFVGTRALDVMDIPIYMDELGHLEDVYFGKKQAKNERELEKLRGLYAYCFAMKPPLGPRVHVPYNLLTYLTKVAPKGSEEQYITEKLQASGYLKQGQALDESLRKRVEYAFNWNRDFGEIKETAVTLTEKEKEAMTELLDTLKVENEADKIQNAVFNTAKKRNLPPAQVFKVIYMILIGAPQGPRLGPYILAMGKQNVIEALERATKNKQ
jgi:lysyl-tRNA synthetase class 1